MAYKKTIEWYDQNAKEYAEKTNANPKNKLYDKFLTDFVKYFSINAKILDAGCGSGRFTNALQSKGIDVVGLDLSKQLISEAKTSYPLINFQYGDLLDLPFQDEYFDGIWAQASVIHFENDKQVSLVLSEFSRVLKQDGFLYLLVRARKENESKLSSHTHGISKSKRLYNRFTKKEILNLLIENDFSLRFFSKYHEIRATNDTKQEEIEWFRIITQKHRI